MDGTVAVIIASFGDRETWNRLAQRALLSVANQKRQPDEIFRIHRKTLCEARNEGAFIANTDWLCFLDCDDELEPGYLAAMMQRGNHPHELRYPKVRYVSESISSELNYPDPVVLSARPLERGNFMVIGTLVQREIFFRADGFRDIPIYEDWDLWIRCWMLGGEPTLVPGSVYRAFRRNNSRNITAVPQASCNKILAYNKAWQRHSKVITYDRR